MRGVFVATFLVVAVSAITRKLYAPDSPLNGGIPLNLPRGTKFELFCFVLVLTFSTFAKVEGLGNFTSWAGFFNVNSDTDNNLFAWLSVANFIDYLGIFPHKTASQMHHCLFGCKVTIRACVLDVLRRPWRSQHIWSLL